MQQQRMTIQFQAIATVHSPFQDRVGMPIQPTGAEGIQGTVEVLPEFAPGLQDLEGFSHLILIYHLHQIQNSQLTVVPFLDTETRGVFATRSPARPNPIGLSIVQLLRRDENILHIVNVDMLDGTPVLDIKPYIPDFDPRTEVKMGWVEQAKGQVVNRKSDDRFL
ncbi:tRNA (N6-threonylcarbamoyladenosine(37)-N6)-methyltransferase TrmO [Spirulina sp. CS-785/01]|uniref:tRNA (N6-threonylcarbamoyladenosine(37)-N6)-methyltransferase TrmO n=1 Tax=Spirulina sp. CS-785/01 TaxID=3021716 RepID=UPI00232E2E98|nr:tRNA (N6-threonylcarbamoyladenosine(37)-N6)-methyltransferase TrmO [Spirulina sp. CS-785/01]MDB9311928.1 tRNA (N6-threonylcarbamoyladenosine(37)-N6)-methyltransferase TrmO [Spirulina sp. CS-785/01]